MKKAIIYYRSKTGTTKYFAEEISEFLKQNDLSVEIYSIYDAKPEQTSDADFVFLGCWTSGLFVFLQHPDKFWVEFAKELPDLKGKKIAFFTTYKLATGSMFSKMQKHLDGKAEKAGLCLKSKNDKLTEEHKEQILRFFK
jgi:flavodoxin